MSPASIGVIYESDGARSSTLQNELVCIWDEAATCLKVLGPILLLSIVRYLVVCIRSVECNSIPTLPTWIDYS